MQKHLSLICQSLHDFLLYTTKGLLGLVADQVLNIWLLTKDDIPTFVGPNTAFGISCALAGSALFDHGSSDRQVWARLPWVILFNWSNLLVFDLANQRLPESGREDALNKPWRPVPSGRLTSDHLRLTMLVCIPLVLALNHFVFHVGIECCLILILTWLYNDLRGGDENWILRNIIIAVAFGLYNVGSAKVAAGVGVSTAFGGHAHLTLLGMRWIIIISGIIVTTMHVQDLKDQEGDKERKRKSAPIVLGDKLARWTISIPVMLWSISCIWFWGFKNLTIIPLGLGTVIAWRCIRLSGKGNDRRTWQLWALWIITIYLVPLL